MQLAVEFPGLELGDTSHQVAGGCRRQPERGRH